MPARVYLSVPRDHRVPGDLVKRAVRATLASEGVEDGEISVAFLEDRSIRAMNDRWLGHGWVPDVLSFALHEQGSPPLGDIYVGVEQAARQAEEHGVSVDEELVRLAVHGTLHVLGYDHPEGAEGVLLGKQEALVRELMGPRSVSGPGAER